MRVLWGLPLCLTVWQSASVSNNAWNANNISCTFTNVQCYSFRTAFSPLSPSFMEMTEHYNDKKSPLRYDQSHFPRLWFFFSLFYTNTFWKDLHMRKSAGLWPIKKKAHPLQNTACLEQKWRSIIVTVVTMIVNIHNMSNKLRSMYNVKQKQHAGKTTAFLQNYLLWCWERG